MKKVLVVDSVRSLGQTDRSLLNRAGFQVFTASTGLEAVEIHRKERVNLIIADLKVPDFTGNGFCSLLRNDSDLKNVSILLTCRDCPEDLEQVRKGGANAWITKPFRPERLLELIGQLLQVSVRQGYRVLLKITVDGAKGNQSFLCSSKNISTTGMLIETDKLLAAGDRITCTFFLPESCQVTAHGEMVRSAKAANELYEYGIRYVDLNPRYGEAIEKFIDTYRH